MAGELARTQVQLARASTWAAWEEAVALSIPKRDDIYFKRRPLAVVLCQIRFPPIYALLSETAVAGFQEAIRSRYPVMAPEIQQTIAVDRKQVELSETAPVFHLSDESNEWRVSIAVDFVALESNKYLYFSEFVDRLEWVLDAAQRTVAPADSVRIGLRKVNDFEHPSVHEARDWGGLLRPELLGLLGAEWLPGAVGMGLSDIRQADEEDGLLAIRHGILPDPGDSPKYRLDLDYSTERPMRIGATDSLRELLVGYSNAMTGFFMSVLTDDLYNYMEPTPKPTEDQRDQ